MSNLWERLRWAPPNEECEFFRSGAAGDCYQHTLDVTEWCDSCVGFYNETKPAHENGPP